MIDGMIIIQDINKKGKDGKLLRVCRGRKQMIMKLFRKNKNPDMIEKEFLFLEKGADLGISPKTYGYNTGVHNYIVMEELEYTLLDHIKKHGCIKEKYQKQMIRILETLDKHSIFHGDISLLNFMFDKTGKLFIIDYGMAKDMNETFIKKYSKDANIKYGITALILKLREIDPNFKCDILTQKVFSKLHLKNLSKNK
jgi:tRNA A-37 threonylcarbamoyl transferase component Bud32